MIAVPFLDWLIPRDPPLSQGEHIRCRSRPRGQHSSSSHHGTVLVSIHLSYIIMIHHHIIINTTKAHYRQEALEYDTQQYKKEHRELPQIFPLGGLTDRVVLPTLIRPIIWFDWAADVSPAPFPYGWRTRAPCVGELFVCHGDWSSPPAAVSFFWYHT